MTLDVKQPNINQSTVVWILLLVQEMIWILVVKAPHWLKTINANTELTVIENIYRKIGVVDQMLYKSHTGKKIISMTKIQFWGIIIWNYTISAYRQVMIYKCTDFFKLFIRLAFFSKCIDDYNLVNYEICLFKPR